MFDLFAGQQAAQQREFLVGNAAAIGHGQAEVVEFLSAIADPEDIGGPARTDVVQHGDVLREPGHVVEGQEDRQVQHQLFGACRDRRAEQ